MDNMRNKEVEEAIKENGYTKIQFAEKLGLTRQGLYLKLNNKRPWSKLEKEKIYELLNVEIED